MSLLKNRLIKQGAKLLTDPRVLKVLQDPRVAQAVVDIAGVPGKLSSFTTEQIERLAKAMALATESEVKDLRRTVRHLEEEVARLERLQRGRDPV